jgi:hypothetical protein
MDNVGMMDMEENDIRDNVAVMVKDDEEEKQGEDEKTIEDGGGFLSSYDYKNDGI